MVPKKTIIGHMKNFLRGLCPLDPSPVGTVGRAGVEAAPPLKHPLLSFKKTGGRVTVGEPVLNLFPTAPEPFSNSSRTLARTYPAWGLLFAKNYYLSKNDLETSQNTYKIDPQILKCSNFSPIG